MCVEGKVATAEDGPARAPPPRGPESGPSCGPPAACQCPRRRAPSRAARPPPRRPWSRRPERRRVRTCEDGETGRKAYNGDSTKVCSSRQMWSSKLELSALLQILDPTVKQGGASQRRDHTSGKSARLPRSGLGRRLRAPLSYLSWCLAALFLSPRGSSALAPANACGLLPWRAIQFNFPHLPLLPVVPHHAQ